MGLKKSVKRVVKRFGGLKKGSTFAAALQKKGIRKVG